MEKNNFPLPLIQEELVVNYWRKNGHLILVNCLREACPGTVWVSLNMTSAVYHGRKALYQTNQTKLEKALSTHIKCYEIEIKYY